MTTPDPQRLSALRTLSRGGSLVPVRIIADAYAEHGADLPQSVFDQLDALPPLSSSERVLTGVALGLAGCSEFTGGHVTEQDMSLFQVVATLDWANLGTLLDVLKQVWAQEPERPDWMKRLA